MSVRREYIKFEVLATIASTLGMGTLGVFFIKYLGTIDTQAVIGLVKDASMYTMLFYGGIVALLRDRRMTNNVYIALRALYVPVTIIGFFNPFAWVIGIGILNAIIGPVFAKWSRDRQMTEARLGSKFVGLLNDTKTKYKTKAAIVSSVLGITLISIGNGFEVALSFAVVLDIMVVVLSYKLYALSNRKEG